MTQNSRLDTKFGWTKILPSLVVPLCVGMSVYLGIMALIDQGFISNEALLRYLTGHPISKITLGMFCVGSVALVMIAGNVFNQFRRCSELRLLSGKYKSGNLRQSSTAANVANQSQEHSGQSKTPEKLSAQPDPSERAEQFIAELEKYDSGVQEHYLWRRLNAAMQFISRTGSASGVDDELKYQADSEFDRQQQRYSLVRILIWATPMLGFLGTVLGISQALGGIQVGPENDFQQMMGGLRSSLYVAFDTTALALTLSIVLMFIQFLVDRFESQLLQQVDERATFDVAMNFASDSQIDPHANTLERIGRTVLAATQEIVVQQAALWKDTIKSAENAWLDSVSQANQLVGENLKLSVGNAVENLGASIGSSIGEADASMAKRWEQWQVTLSSNARMMVNSQSELVRQTELLETMLKTINESKIETNQARPGVMTSVSASSIPTSGLDDRSPQVFFSQGSAEDAAPRPTSTRPARTRLVGSQTSKKSAIVVPDRFRIFRDEKGAPLPESLIGEGTVGQNEPIAVTQQKRTA